MSHDRFLLSTAEARERHKLAGERLGETRRLIRDISDYCVLDAAQARLASRILTELRALAELLPHLEPYIPA